MGIRFGHRPHADNTSGAGWSSSKRRAELAVHVPHSGRQIRFVFPPMKDGKLVSQPVQPPGRVRPGQRCSAWK
jgi:hypothetical protein